jgi:protocatechuate 3,4-dioxygenase beta subunit
MYRINFTALVLIQLLCLQIELSAQSSVNGSSDKSPVKETRQGTSSVSGRVTFKGEPVSGATVSIYIDRNGGSLDPNMVLQAQTDQNGEYRIVSVAAGYHSIMTSASGFGLINDIPFTDLRIAEGENLQKIDFELKRGGAITGRVTDSNNRPLVGERVALMKFFQDGKAGHLYVPGLDRARTDDSGVYRFDGLPAGRYLVNVGVSTTGSQSFTSSHSFIPRTFHPNVTRQSEAKVIEVSEGSETSGVNIAVAEAEKTYSVYGRVISADSGQPIAGVELSCGYISEEPRGRPNITGWGPPGVRTDAKGEFRLEGLMPGKLMLYANLDRESEVYSEAEVREISDNDIHDIELKVRQGGSISGTIVIEGASDPAILSKVSEFQLNSVVMTNQRGPSSKWLINVNTNGMFRIKGLRPGKVHISMSGNSTSRSFLVLRIERGGTLIPWNDGVEIGQGENISDVRVVVGHASSAIQGAVKIIGATLPANQRLTVNARYLNDEQRFRELAETDAQGQFVFENLLPGEYELSISPIHGSHVDSRLSTAITRVLRKVIVSSNNRLAVSLEIDLSRQEGNQ